MSVAAGKKRLEAIEAWKPERHKPSVLPVAWAVVRAQTISLRLGISWAQFCSKSRHVRMVEARGIAAYILREYPGPGMVWLSFPEIAASMERPNHSTAITCYRRVKNDPDMVKWAEEIAEACGLRKSLTPTGSNDNG